MKRKQRNKGNEQRLLKIRLDTEKECTPRF